MLKKGGVILSNLVQANITVEKELWEEFKKVSKANDENASMLIRKYIKEYLKANSKHTDTQEGRKK